MWLTLKCTFSSVPANENVFGSINIFASTHSDSNGIRTGTIASCIGSNESCAAKSVSRPSILPNTSVVTSGSGSLTGLPANVSISQYLWCCYNLQSLQ